MMSVLLITSKGDVTTDFIVRELRSKGATFYRLNTEEIGTTVHVSFSINTSEYILVDTVQNISIDLLTVKSIYFRRPELKADFLEVTPEEARFLRSEILSTIEGLFRILRNAFWLNTVEDIRMAESKIYQLIVAKEIGFQTPATIVTNIPESASLFYDSNEQSAVIKPIRSGLITAKKDEAVIFTSKVNLDANNAERVKQCPVLLQKFIDKQFDVRITVVGQNIFAAQIYSQTSEESTIDWRKSTKPLPYSVIKLPDGIEKLCLQLLKRLNLNFGAIDMVVDQTGNYYFLEINPNGQWAWIERQLNFPIAKTITELLIEKAA
jgi:glutathione synthase/RimK-type ligase-like ATP-grasp enzyme